MISQPSFILWLNLTEILLGDSNSVWSGVVELLQGFIVKLSKVLMMLSICLHNNCISLILVLTKKFDVDIGKQGLPRKGHP